MLVLLIAGSLHISSLCQSWKVGLYVYALDSFLSFPPTNMCCSPTLSLTQHTRTRTHIHWDIYSTVRRVAYFKRGIVLKYIYSCTVTFSVYINIDPALNAMCLPLPLGEGPLCWLMLPLWIMCGSSAHSTRDNPKLFKLPARQAWITGNIWNVF